MRRHIVVSSLILSLLAAFVASAAAQDRRETADILGQEEDGVRALLVEDGASLLRGRNSLSVSMSLPTPAPGSYTYPETGVFSGPGHPEGFTLWAFVFNFPDKCTPAPDDPDGPDGTPLCDFDDVAEDAAAKGGAYFAAGHLVGGRHLQLSGQISSQESPLAGSPLVNPAGAEVHLAVAPHGGLDEDQMPEQIKTPTGPPTVWWVAFFE